MTYNYFRNFPLISYNNKTVRDITKRAKIETNPTIPESPYVFYPYEIKNNFRSDHIAEYYYEDSYLDWLIYMSNDVVDPYYDWYLPNDDVEALIERQHGPLDISQRKVKYYINNWAIDDTQLTPSYYNNTLANSHKKYYTPVFGISTKITSYKRKADNTVTNINRIQEYTIANTSSYAFITGELVNLRAAGSEATIGVGEVEMANSSIIRIKNVSDNTSANSTITKDFLGTISGATASANSMTITFENFSNSEVIFWEPITYYDYEHIRNERKKKIRLIGDGLHDLIIDEFKKKLIGPIT